MTPNDEPALTDEQCDAISNEVLRHGNVLVHKGGVAYDRAMIRAAYALGRKAGIEEAAKACVTYGDDLVRKWELHDNEAMIEDAKSRGWTCLQCAAACRALAGD